MNIPCGSLRAVEDVPNLSERLEATVRFEGYPLSAARNGQVAFDRIAQEPSALIGSDLLRPQTDGFSPAHYFCSEPKTRYNPILILSAHTVTVEQVKAQSSCSRP